MGIRLWGRKRSSSDADLRQLYPIFAPAAFFAMGNWPGPHELTGIPGLGLTWAVFGPGQMMVHMTHDLRERWDNRKIDWKNEALQNLDRLTGEKQWTHELRSEDGSVYAVAMMHEDGVGPSRLLLDEALMKRFPGGYRVAIPDMGCGFAVSMSASESAQERMHQTIRECFERGNRPLIDGLYPSCGLSRS